MHMPQQLCFSILMVEVSWFFRASIQCLCFAGCEQGSSRARRGLPAADARARNPGKGQEGQGLLAGGRPESHHSCKWAMLQRLLITWPRADALLQGAGPSQSRPMHPRVSLSGLPRQSQGTRMRRTGLAVVLLVVNAEHCGVVGGVGEEDQQSAEGERPCACGARVVLCCLQR